MYEYACTVCTFHAEASFTRADQHEYETGHLVVLTEVVAVDA